MSLDQGFDPSMDFALPLFPLFRIELGPPRPPLVGLLFRFRAQLITPSEVVEGRAKVTLCDRINREPIIEMGEIG
jgi:hypothetical protein